ncbi:MAG: AEC family transporter [Rhodospirillales bacterium]|nr:AEC family transporter [Rhodospirillales bacterium]
MSGTLSALAPVFGLIVLGYLLKSRGGFTEAFWDPAERMTFYILFPALLVTKIGGAEAVGVGLLPMAAAMAAATLIVALFISFFRSGLQKSGIDGPGFTSIFQGAIRPNTFIGMAAAYALFGDLGLTLAAAAIIAVIPLVNILSLTALYRWAGAGPAEPKQRRGWGDAMVPAFKNPIILACLFGAALNMTGLGLPPVVGPMLKIIGSAALPLGLMAVGAGLDLGAARKVRGPIAGAAVLKLAVMPALTYAICRVFDVTGSALTVAVLFMALPVASASYVMARQLGGDGALMAGIITVTTIAAALTLPVTIFLVG